MSNPEFKFNNVRVELIGSDRDKNVLPYIRFETLNGEYLGALDIESNELQLKKLLSWIKIATRKKQKRVSNKKAPISRATGERYDR